MPIWISQQNMDRWRCSFISPIFPSKLFNMAMKFKGHSVSYAKQ